MCAVCGIKGVQIRPPTLCNSPFGTAAMPRGGVRQPKAGPSHPGNQLVGVLSSPVFARGGVSALRSAIAETAIRRLSAAATGALIRGIRESKCQVVMQELLPLSNVSSAVEIGAFPCSQSCSPGCVRTLSPLRDSIACIAVLTPRYLCRLLGDDVLRGTREFPRTDLVPFERCRLLCGR